ncbi:MAG: sporulation protein YunB [Clostridia bacterium]|nr:sporulation protein YunB [Clostridia bacterium]
MVVLVGGFSYQYRPLMIDSAAKLAKNTASEVVNAVVLSLLTELSLPYDAFITLSYNSDGALTSLQANAANINALKAKTAICVKETLSKAGVLDIGIPLGTLCGFTLLGAKGPEIPCKSLLSSVPQVSLQYHFDGAGINQTLHSIIMIVTVPLSVTLPLQSRDVEVSVSFLVGETILVGEVPDSYTNVISDPEVADDIFNYGDIG